MDTKELRIGNLVLINGKETIVENIGENYVNRYFYEGGHGDCGSTMDDYNKADGDVLSGVPLTEQKLIEFGFENIDDEIDHSEFVHGDFTIFGQGSDIQTPFYYETKNSEKVIVEYVHHIQNLYFDIKRREL